MQLKFDPVPQDEIDRLCEIAGVIFGSDGFTDPEDWVGTEAFFIANEGTEHDIVVGSIAFLPNKDVGEYFWDECPDSQGTLYIVSTGILPQWQGKGIGHKAKEWEIAYAVSHGYKRIVTNARVSNNRSIHINIKYGFRIVRIIPGYYTEPDEDAVVMELLL